MEISDYRGVIWVGLEINSFSLEVRIREVWKIVSFLIGIICEKKV